MRERPENWPKARKEILSYLIDNVIVDQYLARLKIQVESKDIDERFAQIQEEAKKSKQDFQELCLTHPQVALKVLRVIGARLRRLVGIIEELSFTTVRYRLGSFLIRLANQQGVKINDGIEINLPANNQEIASQIGTVRELVSRNLSRLQSEQLIEIQGRRILIRDLKALEKESSAPE